ncbi:MAG TPA: hypothetical protein VI703_04300 [Anaerolineales bacterium]|nr:hypothetical protein [Anaerolineales bacterium]
MVKLRSPVSSLNLFQASRQPQPVRTGFSILRCYRGFLISMDGQT